MVKVSVEGSFKNIEAKLKRLLRLDPRPYLEKLGQAGVVALSNATPEDTGLTASSWYYEIEETKDGYELRWLNSNVVDGWANVAILLQYGHATNGGGYVAGIDYINPALRDIFRRAKIDIWEEVSG